MYLSGYIPKSQLGTYSLDPKDILLTRLRDHVVSIFCDRMILSRYHHSHIHGFRVTFEYLEIDMSLCS